VTQPEKCAGNGNGDGIKDCLDNESGTCPVYEVLGSWRLGGSWCQDHSEQLLLVPRCDDGIEQMPSARASAFAKHFCCDMFTPYSASPSTDEAIISTSGGT
jgi:hypothetical protein